MSTGIFVALVSVENRINNNNKQLQNDFSSTFKTCPKMGSHMWPIKIVSILGLDTQDMSATNVTCAQSYNNQKRTKSMLALY